MKNTILLLALMCMAVSVTENAEGSTKLQPGDSLRVTSVSNTNLSAPDNDDWNEIAAYSLELPLAPPVHQSVQMRYDVNQAPANLQLQAASDGTMLYLRLHWHDDSEDRLTSRTNFADAVAVQFALEGGTQTSFMMGGANQPVNIWYWKAGQALAQNLAAGGFGSTTPIESNGLAALADYDNSAWTVVFSRPLHSPGSHQVKFSDQTQLALAMWQGHNKQRDGLKHVTMGWLQLVFSPND